MSFTTAERDILFIVHLRRRPLTIAEIAAARAGFAKAKDWDRVDRYIASTAKIVWSLEAKQALKGKTVKGTKRFGLTDIGREEVRRRTEFEGRG